MPARGSNRWIVVGASGDVKAYQHVRTIAPSADAAHGAGARQRHVAGRRAVGREHRQPALHVHQILGDDAAADERDALDGFLPFGTIVFHAGVPGAPSTVVSTARLGAFLSVRTKSVEPRVPNGRYSASPDSSSGRTGAVTRGAIGVAEVRVIEAVLVVGALEHQDEQVAAVLGHDAVDDPFRQVLARVDQHVLRLRRADAVVIERVIGQRRLEHLVLRRLRIARVEESLAVLGPRDVGEAHPAHLVGQVLPGRDVAHLHGAPVGASLRQAVGEQRPIGRGRPLSHRHRAVLGDRIRVEHHRGLGGDRGPAVDRRLPLQAGVARVEQRAGVHDVGQAHARVVPQRGQPRLERLAQRQGLQIGSVTAFDAATQSATSFESSDSIQRYGSGTFVPA